MDPSDQGHLRPLAFDGQAHVMLSEELKHLYTALTRAKNNIVIFDRSPAKRAPFYHYLRRLGMARVVLGCVTQRYGSDAASTLALSACKMHVRICHSSSVLAAGQPCALL